MAAQAGKNFVLKIEDPAAITPGTFVTVGGFRSNGLTLNSETIDVTSKDDAWKTMIAGGIRSMSVSGSGVVKNSAGEVLLQTQALNGAVQAGQVVTGNGDTFEGDFIITSFGRSGEYTGEETYEVSLESAGPISFTAGA